MRPASVQLALAEVASALSKKVALREINLEDAELLLRKMVEMTRFAGTCRAITHALKISGDLRITVYDALFIAVAIENRLGLATCDAKQARAAKEMGVSVDFV